MQNMIILTPRQKQILEFASRGETHTTIGQILGLRRNTVCVHVQRMFQTMGADNMAHAVAIGFRHGLLR